MPKMPKTKISVDQIAQKASRGEDVSGYFTNRFTEVKPVHRVNLDLTSGMPRRLDDRAARLTSVNNHKNICWTERSKTVVLRRLAIEKG